MNSESLSSAAKPLTWPFSWRCVDPLHVEACQSKEQESLTLKASKQVTKSPITFLAKKEFTDTESKQAGDQVTNHISG